MKDEGFREKPYPDNGRLSIGYGTPASSMDETITEPRARADALEHVQKAFESFRKDYGEIYTKLGKTRAVCLVNMLYNLGPAGLRKFHRFNSFLRLGQYQAAAYELYESKWFIDVGGFEGYRPLNRGQRIVRRIAEGKT